MIIKQLAFRDLVINTVQGGILLDNGDVLCGCCGGIYEAADEGVTWKKLKVYNNWIDLTAAICGDDIPIEDDAEESLPERISICDICDFTDTIEAAIRKAYAVVTGKELKTKNDCGAIDGSMPK